MHRTLLVTALVVSIPAASFGQTSRGIHPHPYRPLASCIVIPQVRIPPRPDYRTVEVTGVKATISVLEQVATTTLEITLRNPTRLRLQSELIVPVPGEAVVRSFGFDGVSGEPTARILPREEARQIYNQIVAKLKDPALLEFVGYNLIRSSAFPVAPGASQRVQLSYEQLLARDGDRIDYTLPRSESIEYSVPWTVSMDIRSRQPISTVYSPSHHIETTRRDRGRVSVELAPLARRQPGPFRISYLLEQGEVSASLLAYPDARLGASGKGGGYFLLLAGLPAKIPEDRNGIKREVTLVLDRSGSMHGEKIEQVREAALQVLAGLDEGESFNLIVYNEAVDLFSPLAVIKNGETTARAREYLQTVNARGGTNIHDALFEALRQKPGDGKLPIVLFLTDGLPTMGNTSETAIRALATKNNPYNKRIFSFGVGVDVNTALLEAIAYESRGYTTFVLPGEDVEVKVAGVFKRLSGPVLADARLEVVDGRGAPALGRVREMLPAKLPDLYEGDQLVLLGKYLDEAPLTFSVKGNYLGQEKTFQFTFGFEKATTRNGFVPRLWAGRKIGVLEDAIRELGAGLGPFNTSVNPSIQPRLKELVDEIVRLSTEFGILTEYTAFLAQEGTDLAARDRVQREAAGNYERRSLRARSGRGGLNQDLNRQAMKKAGRLNLRNEFLNEKLERVMVNNVQQLNDKAFYFKNGTWVDSSLVSQVAESKGQPPRAAATVRFGTPEFDALCNRLASEGRQGCLALRGDLLLDVDGKKLLVKGPAAQTPAAEEPQDGQVERRPVQKKVEPEPPGKETPKPSPGPTPKPSDVDDRVKSTPVKEKPAPKQPAPKQPAPKSQASIRVFPPQTAGARRPGAGAGAFPRRSGEVPFRLTEAELQTLLKMGGRR